MPKSPNDKPVGEGEFHLVVWLFPAAAALVLAALTALI